MTTATTSKAMVADVYTQLTTASTGYALIYNPLGSGQVLHLYNGGSAPAITVDTFMTIQPDEAFQRTSDITDHLWGRFADNSTTKVVITE
jgi:hypothetical protein